MMNSGHLPCYMATPHYTMNATGAGAAAAAVAENIVLNDSQWKLSQVMLCKSNQTRLTRYVSYRRFHFILQMDPMSSLSHTTTAACCKCFVNSFCFLLTLKYSKEQSKDGIANEFLPSIHSMQCEYIAAAPTHRSSGLCSCKKSISLALMGKRC